MYAARIVRPQAKAAAGQVAAQQSETANARGADRASVAEGPSWSFAETAVFAPAVGAVSSGPAAVSRKCAACAKEEEEAKPAGSVQAKLAVGTRPVAGLSRAPAAVSRKCAACAKEEEEAKPAGSVQAKLAVGAVDDPLEREADRAADAVMKGAAPVAGLSRAPAAVHRKCAACAKEEEEVQRKSDPSRRVGAGEAAPASVHAVLGRTGEALSEPARQVLEPAFGRSFASVRVHHDGEAAASAAQVGARAYTVGRDIVFASGQYRPGTAEGQKLLAHELAHVVQQGSAPAAMGVVQRDNDGTEGAGPGTAPDADGGGGAGGGDAGTGDTSGVGDSGTPAADNANADANAKRICGPDITKSMDTMLGTVEPWFRGLTWFQKTRSCTALGPGGFAVGVNPGMAWDTRELFLPNTGWLDAYFRRKSCGSPRDSGCDSDATRQKCETAGTCGNSVVLDSKCMLAGTANYALFGKMCKLCNDFNGSWHRWDMRAIIGAWKTVDWDDSTPPKEMASAAYDGSFPTVPASTENRGTCTDRCGLTHGGMFDFIWEPYRPR